MIQEPERNNEEININGAIRTSENAKILKVKKYMERISINQPNL